MTTIYPEATPVQGNTKVVAVLTVADREAPSLATEINAVTSLDLSCFLRDWNPDITVNSGTAPPRLCTTDQMPQEGRSQYAAVELRYPYDPQAADTTDDNKAKAMLTRGTVFEAVVRKGLDAREDPIAVADHVEVQPFRAGKQVRTRSGDDENAEYEIRQMIYPLAAHTDGVVVA